jgi:telomerase protein component 1
MALWRTVRVFISSTFRDMHAERDHLVKVAFPRLRERLLPYRIHLIDIDLRWGLTAEQAENGRVIDLCLSEIDRCRPFFVGIIGQRYGWVPESASEDPSHQHRRPEAPTGKSITALEIYHGVLRNPSMEDHALFYFREPTFLASPDMTEAIRREVYLDEHGQALEDLKQEISHYCQDRGIPLRKYACGWDPKKANPEDGTLGRIVGLYELGQVVEQDVYEAMTREYPEIAAPPPDPEAAGSVGWLSTETDYHDRFAESMLQVYCGREKIHEELSKYLCGTATIPLMLTGESGSGKSSIIAKLQSDHHHQKPEDFLLVHYIGASPLSTNVRMMLRRFCQELENNFKLKPRTVGYPGTGAPEGPAADLVLPESVEKLQQLLAELLRGIPTTCKAIILVDGLNQLDETPSARELTWMPTVLPQNVKIIVSCVDDGSETDSVCAVLRRRRLLEVRIDPLTKAEQIEIMHELPAMSAKTLDAGQISTLLENPGTTNPLYLSVALDELRGFGSFERLGERIRSFPDVSGEIGLAHLFLQVIDRLVHELGEELVSWVLSLIASSRQGLSERELAEVLDRRGISCGEDTTALTQMQVLLRQLRSHLLRRDTRIDFLHRTLAHAVRRRFLPDDDNERSVHQELANLFLDKADPGGNATWEGRDGYSIKEVVYHMAKAARWEDLVACLQDPNYVEARLLRLNVIRTPEGNARYEGIYDLLEDYRSSITALASLNGDDVGKAASAPQWPRSPISNEDRMQSLALDSHEGLSHLLIRWVPGSKRDRRGTSLK